MQSREAKNRRERIRRADNRQRIVNRKLNQPCVDCGWRPRTDAQTRRLEFDHVNPDDKATLAERYGKTSAYHHGWPWARIEAELAKCVLRCKTCHKARTHRQYMERKRSA